MYVRTKLKYLKPLVADHTVA